MPSYMYILECADGSYYTGSTKDLDKRLWQHQNGEGANYTQKRLPVKLVYCESYDRVEDAFNREKQVQGWSHQKKQALIAGNYDNLIAFSRNYTEHGNPSHVRGEKNAAVSLDPAVASTGSAAAYVVAHETLTQPTSKPLPEPVEGSGVQEERKQVKVLSELVKENTDVSLDPALASTGSASAYRVDGITLIPPTSKPLPEPVEGSGVQEKPNQVEALPVLVGKNADVSLDPALASTGSAAAYVVDGTTLTPPTNKPLPEPVEGSGAQEERNQVEALPEPVEDNTYVSLDPALASTGSAAAYVVDGTTLTPPTNKPLPEPVEGSGVQEKPNQVEALPEPVEHNTDVSLDPALASTGSAAA